MSLLRLVTDRLELKPVSARAAAALPDDREGAGRHLGARLAADWPSPHLLGLLARQASMSEETERFGVWAMIERDSGTVVGDIGFHGPPDDARSIEVGYSVIVDRRGRRYATEAAHVLVQWALSQPSIDVVVAGCDPDNVASIRTLEGVGFLQTGEMNGEIRWRLAGQRDRV